jgi:ankyrin repeat protein
METLHTENVEHKDIVNDTLKSSTSSNNDKVIEFLEDNLESLINCPISGTTFFNPVVATDGFSYEDNVINEYVKKFTNPPSPITRELMTKTFIKNNYISKMINFSDEHNLEVSKNKFINGDTFDDNFEIIQSCIENGKYDHVYKFKNFKLVNDGSIEHLFCVKILMCNIHNVDEYVKCIKYILDNTVDKEFVCRALYNIFHLFFRYCKNTDLIDYLFVIIPQENIENMLKAKCEDGSIPMDLAIHNTNEIFKYSIEKVPNGCITIKLINACISKRVGNQILSKLINLIDNIDCADVTGYSPMLTAIRYSDIETINSLIAKGCNINLFADQGNDVISYGIKYAEPQVLSHILNVCTGYKTTVKQVSTCVKRKMSNDVVIKLIDNLDNINGFDDNGMNAMLYAIDNSNIELINYLVTKGYDMNLEPPGGFNAIDYAIRRGDLNILNHILTICENYKVTVKFIGSCINKKMINEVIIKMIDQLDNVNEFDNCGMSLTLYAIDNANIELINYLVTKGYDMHLEPTGGLNAVDYAIEKGNSDILNYILTTYNNYKVSTKLLNSCINKKMNNETIVKLIEQVENISEFDVQNMNPMFYAIKNSNIVVIDHLLDKGYDMNIKSAESLNAYHFVAKHGDTKMVEHILNMCENFDEESVDGWNAVHMCCYYNNYNSIMFLLEKFVNLMTPIKKFKGQDVNNYLPLNLVELNGKLHDDEKQAILDYMFQLMDLQS